MFTYPPICRLLAPASVQQSVFPAKRKRLKLGSRVKLQTPTQQAFHEQEGSVISFGSETGAKELVLVALDSGQSVDVPRKRLEVTRELACCVCHSCLPCEEEAEANPEEADSDLLRCQSCYIPIHQQCLDPPIWELSDGIFCSRCITEELKSKLFLNNKNRTEAFALMKTRCKVCDVGVNEEDGFGVTLLLCDFCPLAFHMTCLTPQLFDFPECDKWRCPLCEAKSHHDVNRALNKPTRKALQLPDVFPELQLPTSSCGPTPASGTLDEILVEESGPALVLQPAEEVVMEEVEGRGDDEEQEAGGDGMDMEGENIEGQEAQNASRAAMEEDSIEPPWVRHNLNEVDYLQKVWEDDGTQGWITEYQDYMFDSATHVWGQDFPPPHPAKPAEKEDNEEESEDFEDHSELDDAEMGDDIEETVNGTPLWELLQNGIKREDLELDSEIDKTELDLEINKTAVCFPTSYDADDLKVIQGKTHAELLRLFTDHWTDIFAGESGDDFAAAYNNGSLFETLGHRLPHTLVCLSMGTYLKEDNSHRLTDDEGLYESEAERILQDWSRCTWGRENPYYGRENTSMYPDFTSEQKLTMIYNLSGCAIKGCYKPLHELKGIKVTDEYWCDDMAVTESGCDGKHEEMEEIDPPEPSLSLPPLTEELPQQAPRPRRPRAQGEGRGSRIIHRWTGLTPAQILRDLVELKVVHKVDTHSALRFGPTKRYSYLEKALPVGKYINRVWGPVAASFDPPLPQLQEDLDSTASRTSDVGAKSRAVFNLIQHLPESIRTGDYAQANAWLKGEV